MTGDAADPQPPVTSLTPEQQRAQEISRRAWVVRWRWLLSGAAVVDMTGLFTSYLIRPNSPTSTATSANSVVVAFDEQYPGLWPSLFGAGLFGLVFALVLVRGLTAAHNLAFAVLVFYTISLAATAHISHGGWATATLAGGSAMAQFVIAQLYARTVHRPPQRDGGDVR